MSYSIGYDGGSLTKILNGIEHAENLQLDRWHIEFSTTSTEEQGDPVPYNIINNYFSIGVVSRCLCFEIKVMGVDVECR